jgi:hypothetical protein
MMDETFFLYFFHFFILQMVNDFGFTSAEIENMMYDVVFVGAGIANLYMHQGWVEGWCVVQAVWDDLLL